MAVGSAFALALTVVNTAPAGAAGAGVGLGTADSFAVLAGSTVTNTGPSVISGDLGVSPGSAVTGFPPGLVNAGTIHSADGVANGAQSDVVTAYNDAAGRASTVSESADLGGQTLVSGVYTGSSSMGLTGTVTLDAQGDPSALFVFQVGSALITASNSTVALINGADPCNVFWQVGSSATLGTNTTFVGTVLALTSISANTGATVAGRLLARNGAVTLDTNVITRPNCTTTLPTDTATPTTTTTPTTTATPTTTGTGGTGGTSGSTTGSGGTTSAGSGPTGTRAGTRASQPAGSATDTGASARSASRSRELVAIRSRNALLSSGNTETDVTTSTSLAHTGTNNAIAIWSGLLAVGLGGLMLLAARRRVVIKHRR